ncbi:MAG: hypothetical protein IJK67_05065 [Bacilli bacterium]|nr:hypothetical protein [Bacilli bacterium]
MNTRMQKYDDIQQTNMSRTQRNQDIYKNTDMTELSRFKANANVSVISDAPKEINIEKIKSYLDSLEDGKEEKRKRLNLDIKEEAEEKIERQELRNYDINSVLEEAREKKEVDYEDQRHRKINNTQYDILKSIKIENESEEENDDELNTKEKTIADLIKNIKDGKKEEKEENVEDLFKDLMADDENTVVMAPITDDETNKNNMKEALEDITSDLEQIKEPVNDATQELLLEKERLKQKNQEDTISDTGTFSDTDTFSTEKLSSVDKSFYTNSMTFTKTDFEGFEDLEKSTGNSVFTKVAIAVAILLLLATVFLILNFVFNWNII